MLALRRTQLEITMSEAKRPSEAADPVHQADKRREAQQRSEQRSDVQVARDGEVKQRQHGNIDPTMTPEKPEPDKGPYAPPPGHEDDPKDVEP